MYIRFQCTATIVFPKVRFLTGVRSLADRLIAVSNSTGHLDLRNFYSSIFICVGTLDICCTSKHWIINFSNGGPLM
jgi:hypothetical protein